jgi:putative endonuclease
MSGRQHDRRPARARASATDRSRRELARFGEEIAARHLQRRGFTLLARNARTRHGEIDLIAFDGRVLAFVEVKTRRVGGYERAIPPGHHPLAGLRPRQRVRLRRLAAAWLRSGAWRNGSGSRPTAEMIRFDAIGVLVDPRGGLLALEHLEGAW